MDYVHSLIRLRDGVGYHAHVSFYRAVYMHGGLSDRKGVRPSVCLSVRHTREL